MKESIQTTKTKAVRRALRVRAKLKGTAERPRMSLHISARHVLVQFIDDGAGKTLGYLTDKVLGTRKGHVTVPSASEFGKKAAAYAIQKGIEAVIFDRGSRSYHGRVKAFADGAREGGLKF